MDVKVTKRLLMTALITGSVLWGGTNVFAAESVGEFELDPIVVTAQRMETRDLDTPATTTIITAKDIKDKVDKDDIINYLAEECVTLSDKDDWYDIDNEEADKWVIDNFDMLVNKYRYKILDHFEDAAKEEAHNKYSFNTEEI